MLDYKGLEALNAVIEEGSFEVAAGNLFITQSAVSQRIKALEQEYGEPVLIRTAPYKPTLLGSKLLTHYKQVLMLEKAVHHKPDRTKISIALNRDSLETWFYPLLSTPLFADIELEIIADDQERTLSLLKEGRVSACLSTKKEPLTGCTATFLGKMHYYLVASPAFAENHFKSAPNFASIPAVKFDKNDILHEAYLKKYFGFEGIDIPFYTIPSIRGFKAAVVSGKAYGLIPEIDIKEELKQKNLISIYPQKPWDVPHYWHSWSIQHKPFQKCNSAIINKAKSALN